MGRAISFIIIAIDVIVIIDVMKSSKDMEKKVLWVLAILFLPVLGVILYYLIGRK